MLHYNVEYDFYLYFLCTKTFTVSSSELPCLISPTIDSRDFDTFISLFRAKQTKRMLLSRARCFSVVIRSCMSLVRCISANAHKTWHRLHCFDDYHFFTHFCVFWFRSFLLKFVLFSNSLLPLIYLEALCNEMLILVDKREFLLLTETTFESTGWITGQEQLFRICQ